MAGITAVTRSPNGAPSRKPCPKNVAGGGVSRMQAAAAALYSVGMTDAGPLKKTLRQQALARRDALDPVWRVEMALAMAEMGSEAIGIDGEALYASAQEFMAAEAGQ